MALGLWACLSGPSYCWVEFGFWVLYLSRRLSVVAEDEVHDAMSTRIG